MIVKERHVHEHDDTGMLMAAGARAEAQMAHYLGRAFGDDPVVRVFHDLRILTAAGGDVAQIDHLVLHRAGFVLLESKSVTSAVRINREHEFSRLWNGSWQGMPSPVQQLKRQAEVLRKVLHAEVTMLRRKALFGLLQHGFGMVPFDHILAISDTGRIERDPSGSDLPVVKADQVVDRIRERMVYRDVSFVTFTARNKDDEPWGRFEPDELERITAFLLAQHIPMSREPSAGAPATRLSHAVPVAAASEAVVSPASPPVLAATCRHCQSMAVQVRYGHNYYLVCTACSRNTVIDLTCTGCGKSARIRKEGPLFHKECKACGVRSVYHLNAED